MNVVLETTTASEIGLSAQSNGVRSSNSETQKKVSDPRKVDNIIQIFFERHKQYYDVWQKFLLSTSRDSLWNSEVQRIYDWFQELPDLFLEFRREILLAPGTGVPVPSNFDEMIWIEAIYGGRVEIDAKILSQLPEDRKRGMEAGFLLFYGISYPHYRDIFKHALVEVIDTPNKRATVSQLPHWTTDDEWFLSMDSQSVCEWESDCDWF